MAPRVLIAGGGVAGPATAIALHQVGIDAVICEAHDRPERVDGAFFGIAANGLRAARALGCLDPALDLGLLVPRMKITSGSGTLLGEMPFGGAQYDEVAGLVLQRAPLVNMLRDVARDLGIPFEAGKRLVAADPLPDRIVARFSDGSERDADLLIGADGTHSHTRRLIDPKAPSPYYTGLIGFGGSAPAAGLDVEPNCFTMMYGRRAFFGCTRAPHDRVWWFANVPITTEPTRAGLATVSTPEWRRRLVELFADDASPASELIRTTDHELHPSVSYLVKRVPVWYRDRKLIIGDAAHCATPSSGQGASMALEDALILAKCLNQIPDVPSACKEFERLRRPRVERIIAYGSRSARSKAMGPIGRKITELVMPLVLKRVARSDSLAWVYHYDPQQEVPARPAA